MTVPWVVVSGDFVPHGGQDRANLALATRLAARAVPVHVVTHRADPTLNRPGVELHLAPRPLGAHTLGGLALDRLGRRVARAQPGARVVVNGGNCRWTDVVWMHCVHAVRRLPAPRPGARRAWLRARAQQARNRRRERRALRDARLVVANSERTRDDLRGLGVPPERLALVPLGVDPERFGPVLPAERRAARAALGLAPEPPLALFVGALDGLHLKGDDTLLGAWAELCRDPAWAADLLIVGGGRVEEAQARAQAEGLAGRVRFLGRVTDVERLLAAADLVVHPSRYDSYGLAVHEALCRGRPAVVSAAAGVSRRLTGELAELITTRPDDPRELAARVRDCVADLPRYAAAAAALGEELRGWTWDDMADRFVEVVEGA